MDHVYATSEVYGSSGTSLEEAIEKAIATAANQIRNLDWFEVKENSRAHRRGWFDRSLPGGSEARFSLRGEKLK